jgi:hypothetical protein
MEAERKENQTTAAEFVTGPMGSPEPVSPYKMHPRVTSQKVLGNNSKRCKE